MSTVSTAIEERPDLGGPAYSDAASRGKLILSEKVVGKIAAQAASEVSAAGGSSGGFLGIGTHHDFSARPKVEVELSGNIASLRVSVGLPYPGPLWQAAEDVRQHITARVSVLTGVDVRQVDVVVAWMSSAGANGSRRLL